MNRLNKANRINRKSSIELIVNQFPPPLFHGLITRRNDWSYEK